MSSAERITRDDLESKLREIKGDVDETAERTRNAVLIAGAAGVAVLVGVAFLLGRRRGRQRTTVVEISRV